MQYLLGGFLFFLVAAGAYIAGFAAGYHGGQNTLLKQLLDLNIQEDEGTDA